MVDRNPYEDWTRLAKKTVAFHKLSDGFELKTDILFPKDLSGDQPHPVIIAYHGGGLVAGARDHYDFHAAWLPAWAGSKNAIILSPDYRLLPQASAQDIIDDLHSLWSWVQSSLATTISQLLPGHTIDLSKLLVEGGSAGGFAAIHLALSYPELIRATIIVYPMVGGMYERGDVEQKLIPESAFLSREEMLKEVAEVRSEKEWVVGRVGHAMSITLLQDRSAYSEAFGHGEGLQPIDRVQPLADGKIRALPERTWIMHGKGDTYVPSIYTEQFVEKIKQVGWKDEVDFTLVDDEPSEHGFSSSWTVEDEKLNKHLKWIEEAWLR